MKRTILVPLDGSPYSEAALPYAQRLAVALDAWVVLIHVLESSPPKTRHGGRHLKTGEEAYDYLTQIAQRMEIGQALPRWHVHEERVADIPESLALHLEELKADFVVMCSHGRTDLMRIVLGNLAQQVISRRQVPLFLIPTAKQLPSPDSILQRILIAMDQQVEHAIPPGLLGEIISAFRPSLRLETVVPTYGTISARFSARLMLPGTTRELLDVTAEEALTILKQEAREFELKTADVTVNLSRGEPVYQILKAARSFKADTIVLTTHGRIGLNAFWEESVASQVTLRSRIPVLLLPLTKITKQ